MNINQNSIEDLITKYLCGEAGPEEAILLEEWKNISTENQKQYAEMEQSFLLIYNRSIVESDKKAAWKSLNNKLQKKSNFRWIYSIAAVLILGMLTTMFLLKNQNDSEIIALESQVNKTLSDESKISLKPHSQITLAAGYGKNNRRMKFTGEGTFTVKHNEDLPFVIESQGVFIEDLGTIFLVNSQPDSDTIYVVVNEGIVRLYDESGNEITIKAGEKAWYIKSQKKIITDRDTKVIKFDFKDSKLYEVIALLEETYDVEIQLSPASIGECKITTKFFDEELATIITILSETLEFKYQYQDHLYKIEGKPCQ